MNIAIIGTGYVGLVTGTCFSEMGADVTCVDIDKKKIECLKNGKLPIYEPGLDEMVEHNVSQCRLHFVTDLVSCLNDMEVVFCAVGTPSNEDGSADLKHVLDVAHTVGKNMKQYILLVTKSTVPVGTAKIVRIAVQEELDKRGVNIGFDVASNPEFLKEGSALKDFMAPDRVVVGVESERAQKIMERLYKPFTLNGYPILIMDILSAEMTKYAANSMLATRISFMNDIANLCELVGANVGNVRRGIGADSRIGSRFLYAGCGYGGSCFPKDVKALIHSGKANGYHMRVIEAVESVNESQKRIVFDKLQNSFEGHLNNKVVAIWGLAFKPETDDMREAPSLVIIDELLRVGASVRVYDPISMDEAKLRLANKVVYCKDMYETAIDADAIVLLTEWKQFRIVSWNVVKKLMKGSIFVDGRNIYDRSELENLGFAYTCIGEK
jgi:UDPglucose 6-dehydrogenase